MWLCLALLSIATVSTAGFVAMCGAFFELGTTARAWESQVAVREEALMSVIDAIHNDASSANPVLQNTQAFKASTAVFAARRAWANPSSSRWAATRSSGSLCGAILSLLAAVLAGGLVWTTRVRRHGEPTERDVRARRNFVIGWSVIMVLAWAVALVA